MEYTNIIQPLIVIGVSFGTGGVIGAFWMFCVMLKTQDHLEKELDAKNKLLDSYINVYEAEDKEIQLEKDVKNGLYREEY